MSSFSHAETPPRPAPAPDAHCNLALAVAMRAFATARSGLLCVPGEGTARHSADGGISPRISRDA